MGIKEKLKKISNSWYFLIVIVLLYIVLSLFDSAKAYESAIFFYKIILEILPIFILIFILMAVVNYFVTPKFVMKHLKEKGIKKWFFVIIGGILSTGPIYMWYPLLSDLKDKGLGYGLIACFLYNRSIKIPLLPIAIFYFTWQYILILSLVMVIVSVFQGLLIDKLMEI